MSAAKTKATPPAKADTTMVDDNKKRKVKEDDEFDDCNVENAQEDSPTECLALTSASASDVSSLPASASNTGATLDMVMASLASNAAALAKIGSDVMSSNVVMAEHTNKVAATTAKA